MKALVVGACPLPGSAELYRRLAGDVALVIAADAAGEWCQAAGRLPDAVLGDFDSAASGAQERLARAGARVLAFPAAKDASDLDLCVAEARRLGASDITLTACTAGRLDHALATLGTLIEGVGTAGRIAEPALQVHVLGAAGPTELRLTVPVGATVSVMAVGEARGVTLGGLRYPLRDATLRPLSSLGLSNVAVAPGISVTLGAGTLLVLVDAGI